MNPSHTIAPPSRLLTATARTAIEWAVDTFGRDLCLLASMQDAVLVDLALGVTPDIDIVFIDTGFHFAETLATRDLIADHYGTSIRTIGPPPSAATTDGSGGRCCDTKVELLEEALRGKAAWISGLRRTDTPSRAGIDIVGFDRRGLVKVNPIAQWNDADVDAYIADHDVIVHPLRAAGYDSIGCATCTTRPSDGARSGRWAGTDRTECGLHL